MRGYIAIILRKIESELKPSGFRGNDNVTIFRLLKFIFSKKGIRRIGIIIYKFFRLLYRMVGGKVGLEPPYSKWLQKYSSNKLSEIQIAEECNAWDYNPEIPIVVFVDEETQCYLNDVICSVKKQLYSSWKLIIIGEKEIIDSISIENGDSNIKIIAINDVNNLASELNNLVSSLESDYILFIDSCTTLSCDSLYYFVKKVQDCESDFIYSDHDHVGQDGSRCDPWFKPQWSPQTILGRNYIGNNFLIKKTIFENAGGFSQEFLGALFYHLILKVSLLPVHISHIPEVLFHVFKSLGSPVNNNGRRAEKAIESLLANNGFNSEIKERISEPGTFNVNIKLKDTPKVSIIIPTKDKVEVLKTCLDSIFSKTSYSNYEVLVIDNRSEEKETFDLFDDYKQQYGDQFIVEKFDGEFNYSRLQNFGAEKTSGEYLLLLNNDTEVILNDWIDKMVSYAQLPNVGAVGVKLFFPNDRIQHVGVVLGIYGIVGHVYIGSSADLSGYLERNNLVTNYSAVTAACLMVSREKFLSVSGFDTELAVEYNDVDFCLKLYDSGLYNVFIPDVQLTHYESLTRGHPSKTAASSRRSIKEGNYFMSKWGSLIQNDPFYNQNLSLESTEFHYNIKQKRIIEKS